MIDEADTLEGLTFSLPPSHPRHNNTSGPAEITKFRSTQSQPAVTVCSAQMRWHLCAVLSPPIRLTAAGLQEGQQGKDPRRHGHWNRSADILFVNRYNVPAREQSFCWPAQTKPAQSSRAQTPAGLGAGASD